MNDILNVSNLCFDKSYFLSFENKKYLDEKKLKKVLKL